MAVEKAFFTLRDMLDEKQRQRCLESLDEIAAAMADTEHVASENSDAMAQLSEYDSTWTNISLAEGIRRLRERITEQGRETSMLRGLYDRSDDVITSCKVALVDSITADHRWHSPDEKCPHVRCIALNKVEALRGD
jgi:tRNA C32,U32 (ribose-2'-O)-methylase TrmJ